MKQETENTNDGNCVSNCEVSQVINQKKRRYTTEKIRCLSFDLKEKNDNPNRLSDQYKFDRLCEEPVYKHLLDKIFCLFCIVIC